MRITLTIDDDVLNAARALAAREHETVGGVISALAHKALQTADSDSATTTPCRSWPFTMAACR